MRFPNSLPGFIDRSIAAAYGVLEYPTTYFLDKDLKLVAMETFLRGKQIEDKIQLASN